VGTVTVVGSCPGNAADVLARCREVMSVVLEYQTGEWPDVEAWRRLLPDWFVEACVDESAEETERWLAEWRSLPPDQQAAADEGKPWSLSDWLYWLEPDEREWFWWDARVDDENCVRVEVEVAGWPTPLGALAWLLRTAGAVVSVEE
jgi:hypothetical protein